MRRMSLGMSMSMVPARRRRRRRPVMPAMMLADTGGLGPIRRVMAPGVRFFGMLPLRMPLRIQGFNRLMPAMMVARVGLDRERLRRMLAVAMAGWRNRRRSMMQLGMMGFPMTGFSRPSLGGTGQRVMRPVVMRPGAMDRRLRHRRRRHRQRRHRQSQGGNHRRHNHLHPHHRQSPSVQISQSQSAPGAYPSRGKTTADSAEAALLAHCGLRTRAGETGLSQRFGATRMAANRPTAAIISPGKAEIVHFRHF